MKTGNKPIPLAGTSLGKGRNRTSSAFTLVELIIVITILAILATIGFMSFQSYTMDARDANRITTIKSAQDGLEIYKTKKTTYPTPDTPVTLTGGNTTIVQGILGKTVSDSIKLIGDIKDPKTSNYYVYSVSENGNYYQIASDLESTTSYNSLVNTTYAEGTKALVKGNYSFDPSLPSLITVAGSVNTSSGIFDPNVCFVIDGGTNLVTSNSTNCIQKKNMSLKDFDTSLVGYWDMETLTGTMLKDLSGNGNDGVFSGTVLPSTAGGYLGKGLLFSSGTIDCGSGESLYTKDKITIIAIVKVNYISAAIGYRIINRGATDYLMGIGNSRIPTKSFGVNYYSSTGIPNYLNPYSQAEVIEENKYYFLASTLNVNESYIYINGNKINDLYPTAITKNDSFGLLKNTGKFYIGNSSINGTRQFSGIIDDIKIYNRALSDGEIAQQARIAGF